MKQHRQIRSLLVGALIASAPLLLQAETLTTPVDAEAKGKRAEQIDALLAMPASERRNHLRNLPPDERQGLWLQVRRAQAERNGHAPKVRGSGMEAIARTPTAAWANAKKPAPQAKPDKGRAPNAIGTITYDSGTFSSSFGGGAIIGNRFNTHTGIPVIANGTVSTVQAVLVPGPAFTAGSAGIVVLGPQTGAGGAQAIFTASTIGLTAATETVTFSGIGANYVGSEFFVLVGDFASNYVPVFGTGTTLGQGHHGVVGYTGGMGPDITSTFDFGGALNGFVRTTGNLVPVELMSFDID